MEVCQLILSSIIVERMNEWISQIDRILSTRGTKKTWIKSEARIVFTKNITNSVPGEFLSCN